MIVVFAVLVGLIPVIPAVAYVLQNGKTSPAKAVARLVTGFHGFNLLVGMMAAGLVMVWLASPSSVLASGMALSSRRALRASPTGQPVDRLLCSEGWHDRAIAQPCGHRVLPGACA